MKILFVNHLLDPVSGGGTAERTFQLLRFMTLSGVKCSVLTLNFGLTPARLSELGSVRVHAISCLWTRFFIPKISVSKIMRIVAEVDVVQLSGHWTLLNAMVYRACRKLDKPYLFCPAGALKPFGRSLFIKWLYNKIVGLNILLGASYCVAITEDECDDFTTYSVPVERQEVIPNGIDPAGYLLENADQAIYEFRMANGLGDSPYVLFLGRLNEIKGPDLLLDAYISIADRFPELMLVFAGPDGGMSDILQTKVIQEGLDRRVRFTGFVEGRSKTAALKGATLLAIPSRHEAMSIVVLEAGSCNCPVLFTDVCGLGVLAKRNAGIQVLVDTADIARGLAAALTDPVALKQSAYRLSETVAKDYTWSIQANRYAELCRKTASGKVV